MDALSKVLVLERSPLDFECLELVLGSKQIRFARVAGPHDLPTQRSTVILLSTGGSFCTDDAVAAHRAGHRVVVFGPLRATTAAGLTQIGVECIESDVPQEILSVCSRSRPRAVPVAGPRLALTAREREVAEHICSSADITRRELAAALGMKPLTVKVHLENIRKKVGAQGSSQRQLVLWLTDLDPSLSAGHSLSERT